MYVGSGVVLIVLGAILRYAVADRINGVDLSMIGLICMIGGVIALLLSLLTGRGRNSRI